MERKEITAVSGWERSGGALYGCVNGAPVQLTYCGDQVLAERPIARGAAHGAAPILHRRHTGAAPWAAPWAAPVLYNPRYALIRGSIRSGLHSGVHTRLIATSSTPGMARSSSSAPYMISGPDGHPGDVRLMSTLTLAPSTAMAYTS